MTRTVHKKSDADSRGGKGGKGRGVRCRTHLRPGGRERLGQFLFRRDSLKPTHGQIEPPLGKKRERKKLSLLPRVKVDFFTGSPPCFYLQERGAASSFTPYFGRGRKKIILSW